MVDKERVEQKIGVTFTNKEILEQAFVHRSFINENRGMYQGHNERLEFLGDAVLELVVTDFLYHKYPSKPEGDLTLYRAALVNTQTLAVASNDLKFNEHLLLSKGESKDTGRARTFILADVFEAVVGAIYIDQGYEEAEKFIAKNIFHRIDDIIAKKAWIDGKSLFQEKAQEFYKVTPSYRTVAQEGPDHDKEFTVAVFIEDKEIARGGGKSKQDAEQVAAEEALKTNGWR